MVQESLIELVGSAHRLRQPATAEIWLWLTVRKQAERHRRRLRLPLPLDLCSDLPAAGDEPELALLRAEQDLIVRRALQAAPDPDRRLLVLRYAGDWTDAELGYLPATQSSTSRPGDPIGRSRVRARDLSRLSDAPTGG